MSEHVQSLQTASRPWLACTQAEACKHHLLTGLHQFQGRRSLTSQFQAPVTAPYAALVTSTV